MKNILTIEKSFLCVRACCLLHAQITRSCRCSSRGPGIARLRISPGNKRLGSSAAKATQRDRSIDVSLSLSLFYVSPLFLYPCRCAANNFVFIPTYQRNTQKKKTDKITRRAFFPILLYYYSKPLSHHLSFIFFFIFCFNFKLKMLINVLSNRVFIFHKIFWREICNENVLFLIP